MTWFDGLQLAVLELRVWLLDWKGDKTAFIDVIIGMVGWKNETIEIWMKSKGT
jgi:hypothetical protein